MLHMLALASMVATPQPQVDFSPSTCIPTRGIGGEAHYATGDLDGDGYGDAIVNGTFDVRWYRGSPSGLQATPKLLPNPTLFGGPAAIAPAGAPGAPAAFIGRNNSASAPGTCRVERVSANAAGGLAPSTVLGTITGAPRWMRFGDWGGDGITDLIVFAAAANNLFIGTTQVHVFEGNAAGSYQPPFTLQHPGSALYRPVLVDADDDGDLDILGGGLFATAGEVILVENQGAAGLATRSLATVPGARVTARWADVDLDGREDVLLWEHGLSTLGRVRWIRRLAGGNFGTVAVLPGIQSTLPFGDCSDFLVADFDGDGRMDWAQSQSNLALFTGGDLNVGLNRGSANYEVTRFSGGNGFGHMGNPQAIDIDSDGNLDIVGISLCDFGIPFTFNCALNRGLPAVGVSFCSQPLPNGSGQSGDLRATGSATVADNSLFLRASSLPTGEFGFLLGSRSRQDLFPFAASVGRLCVGGTTSIARFSRPGEILGSGAIGSFQVPVDLTDLPFPLSTAGIQPGDTVFFQVWHRDSATTPASGLTEAIAVAFE